MNAMSRRTPLPAVLWVTIVAVCCLAPTRHASAQTTYWELEPAKDARVETGTFAVVGGLTTPAGVHFVLKNNKTVAPVVMTVIAKDAAKPLQFRAFKESGPLFEAATDAQGRFSRSFRTGEDIKFKLTGESGAAYQLSVWRGPELALPASSPIKSMSDVTGAAAVADPSMPVGEAKAKPGEGKDLGTTANILLSAIFLVLVVIAVLLLRNQRSKGGVVIALLATLTAGAQEPENIDLRPKPVAEDQRDPRHAEQIQQNIDKFKELADAIKTLTNEKVDFNTPYDFSALKDRGLKNPGLNVAGVLQTALNLLEAFEIIDPREKFLQPDFDPPGLPQLPSRALDDFKLKLDQRVAFMSLQDKINKARAHLEGNYVVLKQTELKTKRLEELADTAGGFSAIAGLYWAKSKADPNDPMNKSKAGFYEKYDSGQQNGLKFLNDALKEMAEFELKNYGDRNWYLYFGLPYYNFMIARYVRQ